MANTNLQIIDKTLPIGSLDAYIYRANQIPMLSEEEELSLAQRWYHEQDLEAARRLVMAHLRFVVRVARGYSGYGLQQADLIQEGNIGLMKAVKRFNPNMGVRLVSFAVHWIKAEIHEFILRNWRIVKVATTKAQRKLFFNLRNAKKRLNWFSREEVEEVAQDLGVSSEEVMKMEMRLHAHDIAFDGVETEDDEDSHSHFAPAEYLEDRRFDPATLTEEQDHSGHGQQQLSLALQQLDQRSQDILHARWFSEKKATLQELAAKYQISAERVRQLEASAMQKLKERLREKL